MAQNKQMTNFNESDTIRNLADLYTEMSPRHTHKCAMRVMTVILCYYYLTFTKWHIYIHV